MTQNTVTKTEAEMKERSQDDESASFTSASTFTFVPTQCHVFSLELLLDYLEAVPDYLVFFFGTAQHEHTAPMYNQTALASA